ncbi:hypothetical protein QGM71_18490 [Virgibacillus sp. C22-A2]|uniref:ABC transporter permease n=1 Tax=Virgibacillus tibetensis TaxID=3042313 RepID=A0ABU6KJG8_9BACI|nr:hypothetical protein [Virgibacillus sp. C22-A2]
MSLNSLSLGTVVLRQTQYKLKAFIGVFSSLIVLQLLALLFSFNGTGMTGTGGAYWNASVTYYSSDIVIIFTMIWAFISSVLITTKAYREDDYVFIANRLSSNLSNIVFMLMASALGAITALLSGFLLKVALYFLADTQSFEPGSAIGFGDYVSGFIATILYILLFAALGYLVGTIAQIHRTLVILLPVLLIGSLFLVTISESQLIINLGEFYIMESSFVFFLFKFIGTIVLTLVGAVIISNKREVR